MKRLISILIILSIMLVSLPVFAQCSLSVSKSASEILVGNSVKVTFKFTDTVVIGGFDVRVTYDSAKLTYVNATSSLGSNLDKSATGDQIRFLDFNRGATSTSCTLTVEFKTKAVGEAKVSIVTNEVTDIEGISLGAPTGSATITVKEENKSSNANLKWLTVPSGCTLVPKFSKNVTEYTCTVPYSITKFPMDWETEDKDAKDSVTPLQTLKVGKNTRTVTVTAPDGTKKAYTVTVIREEAKETPTASVTPTSAPSSTLEPTPTAPPVAVFVNGKQYTLSALITLELPEKFVKEKYIYSSNEIESAVLGNLRLVQLFDGERDGLFVFDSLTNSFKPYNSVTVNERTLTVLDERPEIARELAEKHIVINSGEYTGWTSEKLGEGYYILNVVNDLGENYTALYCADDGSIQKLSPVLSGILSGTSSVLPTEEPPAPKNFKLDPVYIGIGACILILAAIIVVIIVLISKSAKKPPRPKRNWGFESDPYNISIDEDELQEDNSEDFE